MESTHSSKWSFEANHPLGILRMMLRGGGQVMFQENAWTGIFFLIGIFWGAYESGTDLVAWGALVGLFTSTLTGLALRLPNDDCQRGLSGFNGILVGCAFPTFLGSTLYMWLSLILCAALTTWVRIGFNHVMKPWKVNSLTFPFVFCTWIFLLSARMLQELPIEGLSVPVLEFGNFPTLVFPIRFVDLVVIWLRSISQVFLIDSWVTGLFFLIGLLVSSRWACIWAAVGSAVALLSILLLHGSGIEVAHGLYGFSAVLTAIALGATFYKPGIYSAVWTLVGIVVTVFVQAAVNAWMLPFGLPSLTSPFCLATWLFLLPMFPLDKEEPDHSHWNKNKPHQATE